MKKDYKIKTINIEIPIVDNNGNSLQGNEIYRCFIVNKDGKIVSHDYAGIFDLGNNYFGVSELVEEIKYLSNEEFDGIITEPKYKSNFKFKWGLIRLSRDSKGNIKYQKEIFVTPFIYDGLGECNLDTIIACNNDKFTYIDLDINSKNYGKELVPCVLDYIMPFNKAYENFAECSVDGVTGFLPRNVKKTKNLTGLDLLTEGQVLYLDKYLNKGEDINLSEPIINTYYNLTDEKIEKGKIKTLKK